MKIIALDLSTRQGSVAFGSSEEDLQEWNWPNEQRNSGPFFDHLQQIGKAHGRADLVVTGLGPGSYAGSRISVATATGLALGWHAQLFGVPSLCAFPGRHSNYLVVGDARRGECFYAEIQGRNLVGGVQLLAFEELRKQLNAKKDVPIYSSDTLAQFPEAVLAFPSARELARLALSGSSALVSAPLQPLYMREPSITLPKAASASSS